MEKLFQEEIAGRVEGTVYQIEKKENSVAIYLKNVTISLDSSGAKYSCNGVLVYFSKEQYLKVGNVVAFSGQIIKFQLPTNYGQFHEAAYYQEKKIDYKVYGDSMELINGDYSFYYFLLSKIRHRLWKVYQNSLDEREAGIIGAMILGEKSLLGIEIRDLYQQNGISHILSISGLHISFLGLSLYKLLRKIGIYNQVSAVLTILLIFSYGCLTDFSLSTVRSVVMMLLLFIAGLIGRTYDMKSALAFSALILALQNPLQMFNSGFLLSFGAVLGIAYLLPVFQEILMSSKETEEESWTISLKKFIKKNLILSLCVNLTTFPIILYFFYEFPLYSIFLNIIILPFMSLLMILSIAGGVVGCFHFYGGRFLLGSVDFILHFYELMSKAFTKLPWHLIITGRPSLIQIFLYYFVLIITFYMLSKYKKRLCFLLLLGLSVIFLRRDYDGLEITFLDVGQGDGIFFETPKGTTYFVDGGSQDIKMVGRYRIESFLKAKGVRTIDFAIITHVDSDHISGMKELLERSGNGGIKVKKMVLPVIREVDEAYEELRKLAENNGVHVVYLEKGDVIRDGEVVIECLHPDGTYKGTSKNDCSTVLYLNYQSFDLLLTGDVELNGEETMLQSGVLKDCDVLKVSHHGSKNSTSEEFLGVVRPEISIISCGKNNSYGHPHQELLERLKNVQSKIYTTSQGGAITIRTRGDGIIIEEYVRD